MPTQQIAVQSHTMQNLDTTHMDTDVAGETGYTQVVKIQGQSNMVTTDSQGAVGLEVGTESSDSGSGTDKPCEDDGDAVDALGDMQEDFHGTHVEADTVIIGETDTNRQSDTQTDAHINVNIVDRRDSTPPSLESTDTNCNVGTQINDKRTINRSSGKAVKKDKPTPFKKKDSIAKETLHPNSPTPMSTERCDSSLSNSSLDVCRICQCDSCEIQTDSPLVTPCLCSGSLKYIHQACLQKWIKSSDKMSCELCQFEFQMTKKTKPFREWERLEMTVAERRKVVCSVTFHIIAITCVVWSLYVLIDRTTEEVEAGSLLWPFWTKLIVVAIGFTGGVVFMYVQCKMYLTLCKKWRMYNKVIIISSISEAQREKANHEGMVRLSEKQAKLGNGHLTNLELFNVVNETESV